MKKLVGSALLLGLSSFATYATTVTAAGRQVAATAITYSGTTVTSISGPVIYPPGSPNPLSGTFTENVVRDSNTGDLDFIFQVNDTTTGQSATYPGIMEVVTAASYTGFTTDVGYVSGTGTTPNPISMGRTDDVVNFSWAGFDGTAANPIMPGEETPELVIKTDATTYTLGTMGVNDGIAGGATVYGPSSGVPEPASLALLGGGLTLLGVSRLRRKATKQSQSTN